MYISQVLDGLIYLHDQGVIHRDIKGANILATKNGLVKLADFGVATLSTDVGDVNVAGTPYWMAPEIIELTGATTTSDIWSVGCTVIELLDGEPPYHDLPPMGALYRIVQDDHPPIPESVSAMVRDFLMQCFQKDCNLRVSAKKLSKHAWIQTSKKKATGSQRSREARPEYEEAVKSVQLWNEALKSSNGGQLSRNGSNRKSSSGRARAAGHHERPSAAALFQAIPPPQLNPQPTAFAKELPTVPRFPLQVQPRPSYEPEEDKSNWDDDFAEGISSLQLAALEVREVEDEMIKTIRPGRRLVRSPVPPPAESNLDRYAENDEEGDGFDDQDLDMKLRQKISQIVDKQMPRGETPRPPSGSLAARERESERMTQFEATEMARSRSAPGHLALSPQANGTDIQNYREVGEDDFSDLFEPLGRNGGHYPDEGLALQSKLSSHSWFDDAGSDEEDPFAELEEDFHEIDLEANIARDKYARTLATIADLFKRIESQMSDQELSNTCDRLITVLSENPNIRGPTIANHGVIPLLDLIENKSEPTLILKLLSILNLVVRNDYALLESLCLVGAIPVLMKYTSKRYGREIQIAAASFIQQMCHTSTLTLQMFISCRGIQTLIEFLECSYARQRELVWIAINGIHSVFDMQSPTPRNDFCRLLAKQGLLDPLSTTLCETIKDPEGHAYTDKIINVLLIFSQGDSPVKELLATRQIICRMLDSLQDLPTKHCVTMLKCIKNISMNSNTLDVLQNANAIKTLTIVLSQREGPSANDICNHVLTTLFNLCRVNKSRQEEAARAGIVPHLQQIAESTSPLKQFALPMLCDLTHAGKACRNILWDSDCLQVYLRLLKDPYWQVNAIDAILVWLQDETSDVEQVLLQPTSLSLLVQAFLTAKANSFENILEPLYKITRLSHKVAIGMSTPALFQRLMDRLAHPKAVVRLNLLRILRSIFEVHPERSQIIVRYGIAQVVENIAEEDNAVLVKEMAREILEAFAESENEGDNSLRAIPDQFEQPQEMEQKDVEEEVEEIEAGVEGKREFSQPQLSAQVHTQEHAQKQQPSQMHQPLRLVVREEAPDELELSDSEEEVDEEEDDEEEDDEEEVLAAVQRQAALRKMPSMSPGLNPSTISLSASGTIEDLVVKSIGSDTAAWQRAFKGEGSGKTDDDEDDNEIDGSDDGSDDDVFEDSQGVWADDSTMETVRLSPQAPDIRAFAAAVSPNLVSQLQMATHEENSTDTVDEGLNSVGLTESMVLRSGLPKIRLELLDIERFPGWNREMLESNNDEEVDSEDSDNVNPATDYRGSPMNTHRPLESPPAASTASVADTATAGVSFHGRGRSTSDSYAVYSSRQQMQLTEMSRFDSPPPVLVRRRTLAHEHERSSSIRSSVPLFQQKEMIRAMLDRDDGDDSGKHEQNDGNDGVDVSRTVPSKLGNGRYPHNHVATNNLQRKARSYDNYDNHDSRQNIITTHSGRNMTSSADSGDSNDENDDSDDNEDDNDNNSNNSYDGDEPTPASDTIDAQYVTAAPFSGNFDWNDHRGPAAYTTSSSAHFKNSNSFQTAVALDEVLREYPHHMRRQFSEHCPAPPRSPGLRRRASQTTH
ncbi:hypothetical protein BGW42_001592 [Actinomortierella wolfii]|nr:hypothetical protein BGW42_001592 [Actinomortierella wolfii]